jgi:uncharacterized membrane protein YczE
VAQLELWLHIEIIYIKTNYILDIFGGEHHLGLMEVRALGRLVAAHPLVGGGLALIMRSRLGAAPWDVFHVGLARVSGVSVGTATGATAIAALLVARAVGVRPGLGTVVNAVCLGFCVDAALAVVPSAASGPASVLYLAAGIVLLGLGTGLYLSAGLGTGPRDSLMVALARRRGWTVTRARVVIELGALGIGLLLGGQAGIGTLVYALAIGPVAQWSIAFFQEQAA